METSSTRSATLYLNPSTDLFSFQSSVKHSQYSVTHHPTPLEPPHHRGGRECEVTPQTEQLEVQFLQSDLSPDWKAEAPLTFSKWTWLFLEITKVAFHESKFKLISCVPCAETLKSPPPLFFMLPILWLAAPHTQKVGRPPVLTPRAVSLRSPYEGEAFFLLYHKNPIVEKKGTKCSEQTEAWAFSSQAPLMWPHYLSLCVIDQYVEYINSLVS